MTEVVYNGLVDPTTLDSITQEGHAGIAPWGKLTSAPLTGQITASSYPVEIFTTINNRNSNTIYNEEIVATDIETGYKIVFNTMCKEYPEKKEEWKTLLKVYGGCYRATVLAIDTDLFQNVQKMAQ